MALANSARAIFVITTTFEFRTKVPRNGGSDIKTKIPPGECGWDIF